jgi:hypothetical protein
MISVQMFYEYFRPRFLVHLELLLAVGTALPRPSTQLASDDDQEEFDSLFIGPGGSIFSPPFSV